MDAAALRRRTEELIAKAREPTESLEHYSAVHSGALTVLSAVYGPESSQVWVVRTPVDEAYKDKGTRLLSRLREAVHITLGALENLKGELDAGLVGSLEKRLTGEVLTDLIQLARTLLGQQGDAAKDVAAVLAAAAFEGTMRRMGSTFAGMMGGEDLNDVLQALKHGGILVGPQFGIAQSYLTFRNKALHAEWNVIDRPAVSSVLGLVEGLILQHFQ